MSKRKILICASTPFELVAVQDFINNNVADASQATASNIQFSTLIHGVGIPSTTFALTKLLATHQFDLVMQIGIAGSYDAKYAPGAVVQITEEIFIDLGAEEKDGSLLDIFDLSLTEKNEPPFSNGVIKIDPAEGFAILPKVIGGTVNKVNGSKESIERVQKKYPQVQVESMEGGAAAYVCQLFNIPFMQIRAVSNMVEPRNRAAWELEKALDNLNLVIKEMLTEMSVLKTQ